MLPSHLHTLSLSLSLALCVCVLACATTFCVTEGHKAITTTTERDDDDSCKCCACLGTGTDACWYFDSGITQPDSGNTSVSRRSVKTLTQTLSNPNPIYVYATWQESVAVQHIQDTRQQLNSTLGGTVSLRLSAVYRHILVSSVHLGRQFISCFISVFSNFAFRISTLGFVGLRLINFQIAYGFWAFWFADFRISFALLCNFGGQALCDYSADCFLISLSPRSLLLPPPLLLCMCVRQLQLQ